MLDTFFYGVLVFFVMLGIVAFVYLIMMRLLRTGAAGRFVVMIPPNASEEEIVSLVCAALLRVGIMARMDSGEVVAVDCGLPEASRARCAALCEELGHTHLCGADELMKHLTGNRKE
ncbi:MAG: hypothetical protein FWH26_00775 [Oscillospiraceae bacterium]|nr:hypothetical protein [Oscillospiraceae bacterium]